MRISDWSSDVCSSDLDDPPWRPVRAWDDGSKVYIEFPARLDQGEAPPLFVVGPLGDNQLVNYRVSGNHYVGERLFAAAELRLAEDPQQEVRNSRTGGRQKWPTRSNPMLAVPRHRKRRDRLPPTRSRSGRSRAGSCVSRSEAHTSEPQSLRH